MALKEKTAPVHGGRLIEAARKYGIALESWLDLSTGISPYAWPVPAIPERVWRDLPQPDDHLPAQAAAYYGCHAESVLAVPGSQFAIEQIPRLLVPARVAIPHWGYQEHGYRWSLAGHQPVTYQTGEELAWLVARRKVEHAVVINPNNPAAECYCPTDLQALAAKLAEYGGQLLVDEAFMDATPAQSCCVAFAGKAPPGLVVLRSVGKFFGLAGLRLGFVVGGTTILNALEGCLSPWAVSHPARWVGGKALSDKAWQQHQRQQLQADARVFLDILQTCLPKLRWASAQLFSTGFGSLDTCSLLQQKLAERGLLTRLVYPAPGGLSLVNGAASSTANEAAIRFGLPGKANLDRCRDALLSVPGASE